MTPVASPSPLTRTLVRAAGAVGRVARQPADAPLFVYGSLLDPDLLCLVLGRAVSFGDGPQDVRLEPASLPGFRLRRVQGEAYPLVLPCAGGDAAPVHGRLIHGLTRFDLDRLRFYEGESYRLRLLPVEMPSSGDSDAGPRRRRCEARVFLPTEALGDGGEPWDLTRWQRHDKPYALLIARELMAFYGILPGEMIEGEAWETIKTRCRALLDELGPGPATAAALA